MTNDGWTGIMYNLFDGSDNQIIPLIYCVSVVFICSFGMLNLLLSVIMQSY